MRILVTDGSTRAALAFVRSLSKTNHVWTGAKNLFSLAGVSRHIAHRVVFPDPLEAPERYAEQIGNLARQAGLDLVVPVTDASCHALLHLRAQLAPCALAAPAADGYFALSNKANAVALATRHGLAVPEGDEYTNFANAQDAGRVLGFPLIVKPVASVSRSNNRTLRRWNVSRANDLAALEERIRSLDGGNALIQKVVRGHGEALSMLYWGGRSRAVFAHRRIREKPPQGGVSVVSESIPVDPEMRGRLEAILGELRFEGLVMAEFKNDGERSHFIEFNARPWGSMQLAIDSGVDFPKLLIDCIRGEPPVAPQDYRVGQRLRWLLGDLDHAIALARGAETEDHPPGIRSAIRTVTKPLGPQTRFEVLRWSDPKPFAVALFRWLRRIRE